MMPLDYIAIDFETANYYRNSACQIGLVRFENGKEVDSVTSLIRPAKMYFVPKFTAEIHGISYDDVRDKPLFPEIWESIAMPFINKKNVPLVAHNAGFDMNVIRDCCSYYELKIPEILYFDSLHLSRNVWPDLESHKLTDLGRFFCIDYMSHDALEDSRTCGLIVKKAADRLGKDSLNEVLSNAGVSFHKL